ncbi:GNAT family N-acetyltransferase [Halioglobus japonicus]|nr:GNAT family N-acetyltransferase [Halioglobus japonicus]AQA19318.1 GNAT family N-acetyltransferase [Halioglobus japonicus]
MINVHTRPLTSADLSAMRTLLFAEGPNEWNYLTDESVDDQMALIREGKATAVIVEDTRILGFAVLIFGAQSPARLAKYANLAEVAYINDVVVSRDLAGKGYGTLLLEEAFSVAASEACKAVYIERHEENLASAGMMRKAGFALVETFYDPDKRSTGSRNTTVMVKHL